MYEFPQKTNEAVFHVRNSIHAKRPRFLISIIQFFIEPVDFLLVFGDAVYLHTAQNHCGNTTAEQKTDQKVQHRFITSLSCRASDFRNSPSVCSPPVKFGSVSLVKEIYPCFPKSIGSLVITEPP